ncbi:MAG: complex I subunit 4 family protein [Phycisphaerales bacterium]
MILTSLILVPLVFAVLVGLMHEKHARPLALTGNLITLAMTLLMLVQFPWGVGGGAFEFESNLEWMPSLGLSFRLGVDSLAASLIALTALLGPICVVASKTAITNRIKTYFSWLLVLQAAMFGVFAARDLVLFYICFEFTLVPMFILISLYGSTNRKAASVKFFLYTFTGSMVALAGLVYVAWKCAIANNGQWTFDLDALQYAASHMTPGQQSWVLLALMAGFAVKVPLFPLHTWLPLAHTEAPTAGSVILAGVLLKLGTYGILRFAIPYCPMAFIENAPLIATLCIVGILYGGLICWVQTDVKKLVAYSSVAHLGFCVLGLAALNKIGITGSVLYMINHGLSTGALFLCIGMVYERHHTRSMKELGGLAAHMPVWSTFMVFFVMASVGLPGLNGFVSEFMCLMGTFQSSSAWGSSGLWTTTGGLTGGEVPGATPGELGPWYAAIAGIGMIVAAMYLLYMTGKIVWGPLVLPHHDSHAGGHGDAHAAHGPLPKDLCFREIGTLVPLAALCLILGVYPQPLIDALDGPITRVTERVQNARELVTTAHAPAAGAPALASEDQK